MVLQVLRTLNEAKIETVGDLVFVGTVGEEELGDLRGVKALFRDDRRIDERAVAPRACGALILTTAKKKPAR